MTPTPQCGRPVISHVWSNLFDVIILSLIEGNVENFNRYRTKPAVPAVVANRHTGVKYIVDSIV